MSDSYDPTKIPSPVDPRSLKKQEDLLSKIPPEWRLDPSDIPPPSERKNVTGPFIESFLSEAERDITRQPAEQLVRSMARGELKSVDVVKAFCHKAAVAHQLVNCLLEIMFVEAMKRAASIDEAYEKEKRQIGFFHGLPISLKDQFHVKGVDTCMGYVGWIGKPDWENDKEAKESELVREINMLGGVPFCKTNVPQSLMFGETMNNVIGWTASPFNRMLTCGGSSGGEGALVGLQASPLGIGTDIGGSVRIPSSFNDLYGLKPSHGRFPYMGAANSMAGQPLVPSVLGPMAPHLSTLRFFTQGILSAKPWEHDPQCIEIPWRQDVYDSTRKSDDIVFGIMHHDGKVLPQPPIRRAMRMAEEALKKAGIQTVEWKPPKHERGSKIMGRIYVQDGGADIHASLKMGGEKAHPQVSDGYGDEPTPAINATAVADLNVERNAYNAEYAAYWNSTVEVTGTGRPVDAFIMPVTPYAGIKPGAYGYYGYTNMINLLDYSAITIPVTFAGRYMDRKDDKFEPMSDSDQQVHDAFDPDMIDGFPVGVQIVGRRLNEEKVLALADVLMHALLKAGQ